MAHAPVLTFLAPRLGLESASCLEAAAAADCMVAAVFPLFPSLLMEAMFIRWFVFQIHSPA